MDYEVINNKEKNRYEIHLADGELAILEYQLKDNVISLLHTFVPEKFNGQGVAATLAKFSLDDARVKKYLVKVYCPYVNAWLKRHPKYNDIVIHKNHN